MSIFLQHEIILAQVGDDCALLIAHRGQHIDDFDFDGDLWRLLAEQRDAWQRVRKLTSKRKPTTARCLLQVNFAEISLG